MGRAHAASCGSCCAQGDKEVSIGIPLSPFCNRETMNMPKAQVNFIEVFLRVRRGARVGGRFYPATL